MKTTLEVMNKTPLETEMLSVEFEVPNENFDLITAIETAVEDFTETPEGKKILDENDGVFNLENVNHDLPNKYCEAHGFRKTGKCRYSDDVLSWDYNFAVQYEEV